MPETKILSSPVINLLDESFDLKKSSAYHLSFLVSDTGFFFSVLDTTTNKYLALQSFSPVLRGEYPFSAPLQELGAFQFKSVTCAIAHPKFTLVPSALFDEEKKESFLSFNHPLDSKETILSDTLKNLDAKNIFTISGSIESLIRKQFINVHFMHNSTSFIEGLLIKNKNNTVKKVFANFTSPLNPLSAERGEKASGVKRSEPGYFELVILEGRTLLFNNAFSYKTPEDIAYYILFVYEQLHLNPEEVELVLSGEIEKTAREHSLLYNYIRHVKFAVLPDEFKYSYKFDEVQPHRFWNLFMQYLLI